MILKLIEAKEGVHIEIDEDLLAEVVAITESPKALIGSFEERFLRLPPEVIITSMKRINGISQCLKMAH